MYFNSCLAEALRLPNKTISGSNAFRLYDTFGFPIDLTRLMAAENNVRVDEDGFLREQEAAKNVSRANRGNRGGKGDSLTLDIHMLAELEGKMKISWTEDKFKYGLVPPSISSPILEFQKTAASRKPLFWPSTRTVNFTTKWQL